MAWINNDGLAVRLGKEEATEGGAGGVVTVSGPSHIIELKLNATDLTFVSGPLSQSILTIPRGARIEKIEILVDTAFTSAGAATFTMGIVNLNRTAHAATGLINAQTVASLTAGANITLTTGSATAGSLVGTATTIAGLIVANASTAVFTAGKATIRIHTYMP